MSLANDVISIPARYIAGTAQLANKLRSLGYSNCISVDKVAFASGNRAERITLVGEEAPSTNYDTIAQVGDEYLQITFTSGVPVTCVKYLRIEGGAWGQVLTVPQSATVVRTAAKKEIDVQGSNSGTGDYRAFYGKITLTHASAGSGDAVRGYAVTTGGATACRGAHLTGEVGAAGSVTGLLAGATIQCTTVAGLTLSAGTIAALDLVSDLGSAVTSMTKASFIRLSENQSAKLPFFLNIESSATGCVTGTTGATAAGTLKVNHAGTTKYIQLFSSVS